MTDPRRGGVARLVRLAGVAPAWSQVLYEALAPRTGRSGGPARLVQAVLRSEARVLLCERRELRGWELPGGAPEPGEPDADALVREVREETGLDVAVERLVGTYRRSGFRAHEARVYTARVHGGALRPSRETPRVAWFPADALPAAIFPWFRTPLDDALAELPAPVERAEHQGLAAIWAGARIDVATRWRG